MKRRHFLQSLTAAGLLPAVGAGAQAPAPTAPRPIPIAASETVVYESPDPMNVYAYSPGLAKAPTGRLIATMDQGGNGVQSIPGIKKDAGGKTWLGKIYTSDDKGGTWTLRSDMPLKHARPFVVGDK